VFCVFSECKKNLFKGFILDFTALLHTPVELPFFKEFDESSLVAAGEST